MSNVPALELKDLQVQYTVRGIDRDVLRGISLSIAPGEAYGLVGESGCGKSTAAFAAMRYLPRNGKISGGQILFEGRDMTSMSNDEVSELRKSAISMVYQNPIAALNPTVRIGKQVAEVFELSGESESDAMKHAYEALARVQIADVDSVMRRYPHQLSGGMAQRVVIARKNVGEEENNRCNNEHCHYRQPQAVEYVFLHAKPKSYTGLGICDQFLHC